MQSTAFPGPSGAMAAQPICNRQVSGFESPLGLQIWLPLVGSVRVWARHPPRDRPAHIAQLAEHTLGKGEVIGSNPIVGSSRKTASPFRAGRLYKRAERLRKEARPAIDIQPRVRKISSRP